MKPRNKSKKRSQPQVASPVAIGMALRGSSGAGVHADQRRKTDPKVIRRDRAYKDEH